MAGYFLQKHRFTAAKHISLVAPRCLSCCASTLPEFANGSPEYELRCGQGDVPSFGGDVFIDDEVWIGGHVTVLGGVRIGKGAVIGAHSLVTKVCPHLDFSALLPQGINADIPTDGAGRSWGCPY